VKHLRSIYFLGSFSFIFSFLSGCKPILPEHIPYVPIDKTIYLFDPEFVNLQGVGGAAYVNAGSKGLVVYRVSMNQFNVYERHCPYYSGDGCGMVSFDESGLYLVDNDCFGQGCGTIYSLINGTVVQGPSTFPLVKYNCQFDGGVILRIYN